MKGAYIDYSMSVIISRALPDVRDGLKPVHRRILYAMSELGITYSRPYKKSARIVGEVLGKYHPHGDSAVYDTMVRMAQEWSMRYLLVDGQGNFGSVDGDNPAAMRYTEARLQRMSDEMLRDIDKEVVDFQLNFDDSLQEPTVLPAAVPNLLVNGTTGIAVGMATNMPPHNLTEVINGIVQYIDNREITIAELMEHITAPDFPTGGIIHGYQGVKKAFETGRGRVVVRAKAEIEENEKSGKARIIVTELPYQVNKATLIQKTAALVNDKKIDGITAIRDESGRQGMRIVYELRRDVMPQVVLNTLFKYTALQSTFGVNNIALVNGRPEQLNLKELIHHFVEHRHEVVVRRSEYDLRKAKDRAHILEGLLKALDHIDEIIKLIRAAQDADEARTGLIDTFAFSEAQAKAILDMRLQRLTGLERDKIQQEYSGLLERIAYLEKLLSDKGMRMQVIKDELKEIKERYGDERRTQIEQSYDEIDYEDLIANEEMVITFSNAGYIKRTALSEYRAQGRGGTGARGVSTKDDDFTEHLYIASAHDYFLIFTDAGKVYWKRVFELPEGSKTAKGKPLQNLIQVEKGEHVQTCININVKNLQDEDYIKNNYLLFCTEQGLIKKTALEAYSRPRQGGINAITINEGDRLLDVKFTSGDDEVVIAKRSGFAIRFHESQVRSMGRTAAGVRSTKLEDENDRVVGMVTLQREDAELMVISEQGYGKKSPIDEYRLTGRGGKGVKTLNITDKTGKVVTIKEVIPTDDLMIICRSGITIRFHVSDLRTMGRATQGVRLIRLGKDDEISSVAKIVHLEEKAEEVRENGQIENSNANGEADSTDKDALSGDEQ